MKSGGKPKNLKENNIRIALDIIRKSDIVSVAGISDGIRLSKTTVKKMIDLFVQTGLVVSAGKGDSTGEGGKKPELYRFNPAYGYVVSIHVTPDSIIAVTTDLNADITAREVASVGTERSLPFIMDRIIGLVRNLMNGKRESGGVLVGVVVALPGLVDSVHGVSIYSPHYPIWGRDVPFASMLTSGLERGLEGGFNAPLFVDCVNRYQALAEREKGVAGGVGNFIIIDALNEGIGSGIILNGEIKHGAQSLSGEVGHITLDAENGPECICGNKGCFEALVSAKRITALARAALGKNPASTLFSGRDPAAITLSDVCEGASRGDELCRTLVADAAKWFVVGLGNIIMVNDPELIVIQGEYVKAGDYFLGLLREGIKRIGLPDVEKRVRIEYSVMGADRGVVGGAAFVIGDFFDKRLLV